MKKLEFDGEYLHGGANALSKLARAPSMLTKIVSEEPSSVKDRNNHRTSDRSFSTTIDGVVLAKEPKVS